MEDNEIVALYLAREQGAIAESAAKYGKYCFTIAYNILYNHEDADESVNDTWLHAWKSIPPHEPTVLSTYLGKLTRYIALKKWRGKHAQKRGGGEVPLVLDELTETVPAKGDPEEAMDEKELTALLNRFLQELPVTERRVFLCRYWYLDPIASISKQFDFTESKVKSMLLRTRKKLAKALKKEGITL